MSLLNNILGMPRRKPQQETVTSNKPVPSLYIPKSALPVPREQGPKNYRLILAGDPEFKRILEAAGDLKRISFDFETAPIGRWRLPDAPLHKYDLPATDPHRADICTVSFSVYHDQAWVVPIAHQGCDRQVGLGDIITLFHDLNEMRDVSKICHNIEFESKFLYKYGVRLLPKVFDTMAFPHLAWQWLWKDRKTGLKFLMEEIFGVSPMDFETVTKGRHFDELDVFDPTMLAYSGQDADFTLQLRDYYTEWAETNNMRIWNYVSDIESPWSVIIGGMEFEGVPIDKAKLERDFTTCNEQITEMDARLRQMAGKDETWNPGSSDQLVTYFYDHCGYPILSYTKNKKTGEKNPSADEKAIKKLRAAYPERDEFFSLLLLRRQWAYLRGTYVEGWLSKIHPVTGKLHGTFKQHFVETGRLSMMDPNLLNPPREGKRADGTPNDPIGVRRSLRCPNGYVVLEFDESQIELRVLAWASGDATMREVYLTGGDIHNMTTEEVLHVSMDEEKARALGIRLVGADEWSEARTKAKAINFGIGYGLSGQGLQADLEIKSGILITVAEADAIVQQFLTRYPGVRAYQEKAKQLARTRGWIGTIFGRKRSLEQINSTNAWLRSNAENAAMNTPIQGSAADIMKLQAIRLWEMVHDKPWFTLVLQMHDALYAIVPDDPVMITDAARMMKTAMEMPVPGFDIPLIADGKVGPNWADKTKIKM